MTYNRTCIRLTSAAVVLALALFLLGSAQPAVITVVPENDDLAVVFEESTEVEENAGEDGAANDDGTVPEIGVSDNETLPDTAVEDVGMEVEVGEDGAATDDEAVPEIDTADNETVPEIDTADNETVPDIVPDIVPDMAVEEVEVEVEVGEDAAAIDDGQQEAVIHTVRPCNIQAAVDAAEPGDVVEVQSGIYREKVNVTKSITLKGVDTGMGMPVVDAEGNGSAITLSADGVVLEGFYITGSGDWPEAGIRVTSNDNVIKGNNVWNNVWFGIYLNGGDNNTVSGNIVSNNGGDGVLLFNSDGNSVENNVIGNNKDNGVRLLNSSENDFRGNVVSNNDDNGIFLSDSENVTITANILGNNNLAGIHLEDSIVEGIDANQFVNNTIGVEES